MPIFHFFKIFFKKMLTGDSKRVEFISPSQEREPCVPLKGWAWQIT
jgi:hypothetical protein